MKFTISYNDACSVVREHFNLRENVELEIETKDSNFSPSKELLEFINDIEFLLKTTSNIAAVKRYKEFSGVGLFEAKVAVVDCWEKTRSIILQEGRLPNVRRSLDGISITIS